jgi:hypothetical protein
MKKKKSAGAKYFGKPVTGDPDDAPELLSDFFRHGELRHGEKLIRRGRPPLSGKPKTAITLRLDEDVVEAYRETSEGWQTRIDADLRRVRKLRTAQPACGGGRAPQTNEIVGFRRRGKLRRKAAGRPHLEIRKFCVCKVPV